MKRDINETKEGMLKFVVVDPDVRGKEVAQKMLRLAVKQAFDNPEAERVQLNVFPENPRAKRCYEKAGFVVRNFTPDAFTFKDETWGRCNMVFFGQDFSQDGFSDINQINRILRHIPSGKDINICSMIRR